MNSIRKSALPFVFMAGLWVSGCGGAEPGGTAGEDPAFSTGGSGGGLQPDDPPGVAQGGGMNLGGGPEVGGSSSNGSGGGCSAAKNACNGLDEECDDGNPCTTDTCNAEGEFFGCKNTPIPNCQGDPTAPIDSSCEQSSGSQLDSITIPYVPLVTPNLPASCQDGFEWQNCSSTYVVPASDSCGITDSRTLYIDIATYTLGDRLRITGVGPDNQEYVLLDTCRIRTWDHPDPTNGKTRPPDDTIRQFQIVVKAGTKSLKFDSMDAHTPWYMRVLGMCDFEPLAPANTCAWRAASL